MLNLLTTLRSFGVVHTLPITTHLHDATHPGNNLCLSRLRPRGVCCAYAGVGMHLVHAGAPGRKWTVEETHPYMLFLQRWWLTGAVPDDSDEPRMSPDPTLDERQMMIECE